MKTKPETPAMMPIYFWLNGVRTGIALESIGMRRGEHRTRVLILAGPETEVKIIKTKDIRSAQVKYKGRPYPLRRALMHARRMCKSPDISKRAKKAVRQIAEHLATETAGESR